MIRKYIILIMIAGIAVRFLFVVFFANLGNNNYWEYGDIAKNLANGKGYSYFYEKDGKIDYLYNDASHPLPSAYMPPGYVITLIPFMLINETIVRNICIFSFQIILSLIVIFLLFKLVRIIYNEKIALIAAAIYSIVPEFLYSSITFGTVIFYHLGVVSFFLIMISKISDIKKSIAIGLLSSIIIYYRPEFLLFIVLYIFVIVFKKIQKHSLISILIIFVLISPWLIRNYIVFNEYPVFTTNVGQNFYRGHNNYHPGVWSDENVTKQIDEIEPTKDYEIKRNKIFLANAFESIKQKPKKEFTNDFEKVIHLWLFYYYDTRALNIVYIIPWLIILLLGIYGFIKTNKSLIKTICSLFFIYHTLLAIIFFSLARYQTNMKIMILPFTAYGILILYERIKTFKSY